MKIPQWELDLDTLLGRPISAEVIKEFIRNLLKNENKKKESSVQDNSKK